MKLADFGSCFAAAGVDTGRLSFELQTLSYRAPEVGCQYLSQDESTMLNASRSQKESC